MFADPWNPSSGEVRAWAYSSGSVAPCEDWELALLWAGHERDYLEFAEDHTCPSQRFFLSLLYFIVGNAVRKGLDSNSEAQVRGFIKLGATSKSIAVRLWYERSLALLTAPSSFTYDSWCCGGLANEPAA